MYSDKEDQLLFITSNGLYKFHYALAP